MASEMSIIFLDILDGSGYTIILVLISGIRFLINSQERLGMDTNYIFAIIGIAFGIVGTLFGVFSVYSVLISSRLRNLNHVDNDVLVFFVSKTKTLFVFVVMLVVVCTLVSLAVAYELNWIAYASIIAVATLALTSAAIVLVRK